MDDVKVMDMFCEVCTFVMPHKYILEYSTSEVWECKTCGLRSPRKKENVQLQFEEPRAPDPIITKEVRSNSNPDVSYLLTKDSSGWRCDCPGFRYRGKCTHAKEAARAARMERNHEAK